MVDAAAPRLEPGIDSRRTTGRRVDREGNVAPAADLRRDDRDRHGSPRSRSRVERSDPRSSRLRQHNARAPARGTGAEAVIPTAVRIFVCTERQDMRRSFDALALAVRENLALDPESGALFVFASKRGNRLKVLWFDHNGYCLLYKRLHGALFELPDATASDRPVVSIDGRTLATILRGVPK